MAVPNRAQNLPNHIRLNPWGLGGGGGAPVLYGYKPPRPHGYKPPLYGYKPPSSQQPPSVNQFFHLGAPTQRPSRKVVRDVQTPQGLTRNGKLIKSYDIPVPTRGSHPTHKRVTPRRVSPIEEAKVGSLTGAAKRAPTVHHVKKRRRKVIHRHHHGPEAGNGPYYGNVLASGSSGIDTSATNSSQSNANADAIAALQSQLQADEGTLSAIQSTVDAINQEASAPTTPTSSSSSFLSTTFGKVVLVGGVALGAWWYIRHRKTTPKRAPKKAASQDKGVSL